MANSKSKRVDARAMGRLKAKPFSIPIASDSRELNPL